MFKKIVIVHHDSKPNLPSHDSKLFEGGDMSFIKEKLIGVCNWSVEGAFIDGNKRVNLLWDDNKKAKIEDISTNEGFTHILYFY